MRTFNRPTIALAAALLMLIACAEKPVTIEPAATMKNVLPSVQPVAETAPVQTPDDAADDPAIWVHPGDPARSLIVTSQKKFGLMVYSLDGKLVQSLPIGRINNVDLRDGFVLAGKTVAIIAGSNRSNGRIALFALDHDSGLLRDVADSAVASGFDDPYGLCLYHSRKSGEFQVIVNAKDGRVRQSRLLAGDNGKVRIELLREFKLPTQPEGCVADDELGNLFVGEEDRGVWVLGAEPADKTPMRLIDKTGADGHLVADVEGMSLWTGTDGRGWLVVSSQGEHAYAVYRREAPHVYVGKFRILANTARNIDGASETDGLDITSANLGGDYSRGLLVVQDGHNLSPAENQNFKLVPWAGVEKLLPKEPSAPVAP